MSEDSSSGAGTDFTQGIPATDIADGCMVSGHVGKEPVLLVRQAGELFAIGATCRGCSGCAHGAHNDQRRARSAFGGEGGRCHTVFRFVNDTVCSPSFRGKANL